MAAFVVKINRKCLLGLAGREIVTLLLALAAALPLHIGIELGPGSGLVSAVHGASVRCQCQLHAEGRKEFIDLLTRESRIRTVGRDGETESP